jgi:pimeloyl-ACP methyl ester carboxylesterase
LGEVPIWFREALADPGVESTVEVDGCAIHYIRWGDPASPGIVLVHGGGGHAHWWSYLAPMLARQYCVVALDLSGHGDSGRRETYPREIWADEIMAVSRDAGIEGSPVLVGHSMGGLIAIFTAALYGHDLAGVVVVDAPVRKPDPETEEAARKHRGALNRLFVYRTREAALRRFQLIPPQPIENDFILDHIAWHSVREVENHDGRSGWTWKFHPLIYIQYFPHKIHEHLADVKCRIALFKGELSTSVTPETHDYMVELLDRNVPEVEIPQAYHHLLIDQPLAFVAALRAVLSDWEHTVPRHGPGSDRAG